METSVHCHFKKDTLLLCLAGTFKINLYKDKDFKIVNILESLYIPRETFHGIHAYTDNCILMEIELYTESVSVHFLTLPFVPAVLLISSIFDNTILSIFDNTILPFL